MARGHALAGISVLVFLVAGCSQPSSEELLAKARSAMGSGEVRTAEIHLKNLLQQDGNNGSARALLGEVLLGRGDYAGAEQHLRKAYEISADKAPLQLPLVRSLMGQQKHEDALKQIETGPRLQGEDQISLLILQGAAQRATGFPMRAEEAYREALTINPSSAPARTELAALELSTGRVQEGTRLLDEVLADAPQFTEALLLRGRLEVNTGRRDVAATTFEGIVEALRKANRQRSVEYAAALFELTDLRVQQRRLDDAAKLASELLALNPQNPASRYAMARVEFEHGDASASEARLESLIAQSPDYAPAQGLLGLVKMKLNKEGQARQYLSAAISKNPNDSVSRLALAEFYIRSGDTQSAKLVLNDSNGTGSGLSFALAGRMSQLAGRSDAAATFFDESERNSPTDPQQLANLSRIYMEAGEFERAIRMVQGSNVDGPRSEQLKDYLLALVQVRAGDLKAAGDAAQRLADAVPKAAWPQNLRGMIALRSSDLAGARAAYARATEIDPRDTTALANLARISLAEGKRPEAEQHLQRLLVVAPDDPLALGGLGQLAAERHDSATALSYVSRIKDPATRYSAEGTVQATGGHFDAAADAYSKAYESAPSAELAVRIYDTASRAGRPQPEAALDKWIAGHPQDARVRMLLGSVALRRGDGATAISHYEAVLSANPSHPEALNNLAWLYGERGDAKALDLGKRAYEASPNNPSVADTYGWLQVRNGAPQAGLTLLTRAVAGLPKDPDVRYHWAVALADSGDAPKAAEALRTLLRDNPNFSSRAAAEKSLANLEKGVSKP